ncbi:MAG: amidohydrolase family protein, partial [Terriglobia bacterium]
TTTLASIIEFGTHVANGGPDEAERVRGLILAAEDHGLAIRMRGSHDSDPRVYTLARQAGIVAWVGVPPSADIPAPRDFGGVYVLPASESLQFGCGQAPNVRSAINDGIPIAIGSSCPAEGPRSSNPQFLLYLGIARFGLSHEEAIMACTYNAACSLKLSHVTGSLEPGKSADLIVMDVHDYHELAHHVGHNDVLLAMRAGRTVYRRTPINGVEQGTPPPRLS